MDKFIIISIVLFLSLEIYVLIYKLINYNWLLLKKFYIELKNCFYLFMFLHNMQNIYINQFNFDFFVNNLEKKIINLIFLYKILSYCRYWYN